MQENNTQGTAGLRNCPRPRVYTDWQLQSPTPAFPVIKLLECHLAGAPFKLWSGKQSFVIIASPRPTGLCGSSSQHLPPGRGSFGQIPGLSWLPFLHLNKAIFLLLRGAPKPPSGGTCHVYF